MKQRNKLMKQKGAERKVMKQLSKKAANRQKVDGKPKRRVSRKLVLSIIAGLLLVVNLAIGVVAITLSNTRPIVPDVSELEPVEEPEEPEDEVNTEDLVDEPEEVDAENYQVSPNKPRFFTLASIGLHNVPVTEFGLVNGNQLGAPKGIRVVGWYYQSAFPGKQGVTVLNGHGGGLGNGIFRDLPRAKVGDEVVIETGDGHVYTYVIEEMTYKALGTEANSYMYIIYQPLREGVPTLTMITCTGNWIRELQTYDQRLFVRASLRS